AVAINVTIVAPTANGFVELYPTNYARPGTSTVNFRAGRTRANNSVMTLGPDGALVVYTSIGGGSAHLLIDVVGYFE
ncbi:MAG TPA: SGNH/GDSL hydrolase family protein, partial [Thermoanaerobaculia bacterium]